MLRGRFDHSPYVNQERENSISLSNQDLTLLLLWGILAMLRYWKQDDLLP